MLNPISVSLNNKIKLPLFGQYQSNPIVMNRQLATDTFEHAPKVANVSFTSVDNTIVGRSIRELGDVPCPYCGIRVINGKEISHLNKENLGGSSKKALALLKPFEDRMHPVEKQVFNLLESLSKKNPKKPLRELLDKVRPEHLEIVKSQEYEILDRMHTYSQTIQDKQVVNSLDKLLCESVDIINKQDDKYIFRRRRLLEKLNAITDKMQEKDKAEGLLKIADEIPRAHDNMSAFIVKYSQKDPKTKQEKTSYQLGLALVEPSVGSLEHVVPRHPQDKSTGGENKFENYIYASREWNTKRKNMPLDKWVMKHPEIKDNMQTYMDAVIDKINTNKALKNCRIYPIIIAKTLKQESKGLINLDISKLKLSKKEITIEIKKLEAEEAKRAAKKKSTTTEHISLIG